MYIPIISANIVFRVTPSNYLACSIVVPWKGGVFVVGLNSLTVVGLDGQPEGRHR